MELTLPRSVSICATAVLSSQCCSHGWIECCNTSYITNTHSLFNQDIQECLADAVIPNYVVVIDIDTIDRGEEEEEGADVTIQIDSAESGREKRQEDGEPTDRQVTGGSQQTPTDTCILNKTEKVRRQAAWSG